MIPFLDCSANKLPSIAADLGSADYGQLLTPLTNYALCPQVPIFGIDNGGFSRQDYPAFLSAVERRRDHKDRCKFVVMPDVPGSMIRTLELFKMYSHIFRAQGWPVAIAIQNGAESMTLPWHELDAIFIAGTDPWRYGECVKHIISVAKWRQSWVHVGRVSNPITWDYWADAGCDSADSSAFVLPFPGRRDKMRKYFKDMEELL